MLPVFGKQALDKEQAEKRLGQIIQKISTVDLYIGRVAQAEVCIWKASSDEYAITDREMDFEDAFFGVSNAPSMNQDKQEKPEGAAKADLDQSNYHHRIELSKPNGHVKDAIAILKDLINDKPK